MQILRFFEHFYIVDFGFIHQRVFPVSKWSAFEFHWFSFLQKAMKKVTENVQSCRNLEEF